MRCIAVLATTGYE